MEASYFALGLNHCFTVYSCFYCDNCSIAGATFASENLALGKPTFQSSTTWDGDSSKAVDGDRTTVFGQGSCTHTATEQTPWWAVDLQQRYLVHRVDLTNRAGQTSELQSTQILISHTFCIEIHIRHQAKYIR